MTTHPETERATAKVSDDEGKTSPGLPLERRGRTSSGEHGQTTSEETDRPDGNPVTKRARMDSDGSAKTTECAIDAVEEDAVEATNGDVPSRSARPHSATAPKRPALGLTKSKEKMGVGASRRNGATPIEIPEGRMRCSRNDGKNWRCSEMAMSGHKHCQKHMRWSAGGRSKQRGSRSEREGAASAKRPRWLSEHDVGGTHGTMPVGFPTHLSNFGGASNPLLAAPLLNVAASALDDLRHKEAVLRAMSRGVSSAFGAFGGFPGATAFSGFNGHARAGATYRPTASKASISIDSLAGFAPVSHARVASAAPVSKTADGASRIVECEVELVPAPAGSGRGASARGKIDLATIDSFDALHVELADVVGASRPAGGRYDPSALQIAYVDASGAPAVLGAEPWETFTSRVAFVQARLLAPGLNYGSNPNSPRSGMSTAAAPMFHMPWMMPQAPPAPAPAPAYNPFAALLGVGQPPTASTPTADPATMAMLMSMFVAASGNGAGNGEVPNPFSAAAFAAAGFPTFPKVEDTRPAAPR